MTNDQIDTRVKPTELTDRMPTIEDVRRVYRCRSREFECIVLSRSQLLLEPIAVDEGWLLVIGDPDNASYEWVSVACSGRFYIDSRGYVPRAEADEKWEHSNAGYGGVAGALLEGLLRVQGIGCGKCGCCVLPEEIEIRCRGCSAEESRHEP